MRHKSNKQCINRKTSECSFVVTVGRSWLCVDGEVESSDRAESNVHVETHFSSILTTEFSYKKNSDMLHKNFLNSILKLINYYSCIAPYSFFFVLFFVNRNYFPLRYLYSLQNHCLSHCSIAMKRHHDQGNSYEGKNFPGPCL